MKVILVIEMILKILKIWEVWFLCNILPLTKHFISTYFGT